MAKPAKPHDLRINYAGAVFVLEPRSPAGQEWLAQAVETDPDRPGRAVRLPLRHLDDVLRVARKARLRLAVPWE